MSNLLNDIFKIPNSISNVQRFSQLRLSVPENVLEHSGFVCLLSFIISKRLILEGAEINMGELLSKAILHDVDESITGDISQPVKYYSKRIRDLIGEMEAESVKQIDYGIGMQGEIYSIWESAKDNTTEGLIVSLCDTLSVLNKASDEIERGNMRIKGFITNKISESIKRKITLINNSINFQSKFLDEINECAEPIVRKIL